MSNNEILLRIAKDYIAFRKMDMWKAADKAVSFVKNEFGDSAYADETRSGAIKFYYGNGNDFLWMIMDENGGFYFDADQIKDAKERRQAEKYLCKNEKSYKNFNDFKDELKNFKEVSTFSMDMVASNKTARSKIVLSYSWKFEKEKDNMTLIVNLNYKSEDGEKVDIKELDPKHGRLLDELAKKSDRWGYTLNVNNRLKYDDKRKEWNAEVIFSALSPDGLFKTIQKDLKI